MSRRPDLNDPHRHPASTAGTPLYSVLSDIIPGPDKHAALAQFVSIANASGAMQPGAAGNEDHTPRPFLSVITRTQGRRSHTLEETLICLAGQTDGDFEILVMGHNLKNGALENVERVIADQPESLRRKIRFVKVDGGGRTRPLNRGFEEARGHYVTILDDDDVPLGHWVETFKAIAQEHPAQVLRACCVRQDVKNVGIGGVSGLRAIGPMENLYPSGFNFVEHLRGNGTPGLALAFPREAFHLLGFRFDETLTTTEDWDFLLRVTERCGVACSPEITSLYRWWKEGESSRTSHDEKEWLRNYHTVLGKLDGRCLILPQGAAAEIRGLLEIRDKYNAMIGLAGAPAAIQLDVKKSLRRTILWLTFKRYLFLWSRSRRRRYKLKIKAAREWL